MTFPAQTTLQDIIILAQEQYGIRFQLTPEQLVKFANMVQMIVYNNDLTAFEEWNQKLFFGQDVFLNNATYTPPTEDDIGLQVEGSTFGPIGTLLNFKSNNRINQWIIEPLDGAGNFTLTDGETLTIPSGSATSGVVSESQDFNVSNGPYRAPRAATGNPPFRKFIGLTKVTDKQIYGVPAGASEGSPFDYGLDLNYYPERRVNVPSRWDETRKEVMFITNDGLEITQTPLGATAPNTLNDSDYRWVYYINPPVITSILDEASLIIPEEYRYEILYKGIERLADTATYGDQGNVRELIGSLCERFWEDKGIQFEAFGKANSWISHGDTWDDYGNRSNRNYNRNQGLF